MTYDGFKKIILKIDGYYPTQFKLEEYQMKYWYEKMKEYDESDIEMRIDSHISGEYSNTPPKLAFLLKNVKTIEEKAKTGQWYIECKYCHKKFRFPQERELQERCFNRCMSIDYISNMSKKFDINPKKYFKENVKNMNDKDFDSAYLLFLKELYKNRSQLSLYEIKIIEKILYSSEIAINQMSFAI